MGNWHRYSQAQGTGQWHLTLLFPLTMIRKTMYGTNFLPDFRCSTDFKRYMKISTLQTQFGLAPFPWLDCCPSSLGDRPLPGGCVSLQHLFTGDPVKGTCGNTAECSRHWEHSVYMKTAEERHIYSYSNWILVVSIFDQYI